MAKVLVVAVRDQAVAAFGNPWYAQTSAHALRLFSDAVNSTDSSNEWAKHPEDFSLWELGEFDKDSGKFELIEPRQVVVARDLIQKK